MKQEKERLWWFYWTPNMIRHFIWPGVQFAWSEFLAIRVVVYFVVGVLGAPAVKMAWNTFRPARPISTMESVVAFVVLIGVYALLTRTPAGNDILGVGSAVLIVLACLAWILASMLPAIGLYALGSLSGEPRSTSIREFARNLFFGPLEWADKQFFLNRRAGN